MEIFWQFVKCFFVGGLICLVGQILILKTKLTSARILVLFVCAGAVLTALGLYGPLVEFAGAGATVPLTGFGYSLAQGAIDAVHESGIMGAFSGGVVAASTGITAAILFGYLAAVIFTPKTKG
jgi:stage V sporulation protein AE